MKKIFSIAAVIVVLAVVAGLSARHAHRLRAVSEFQSLLQKLEEAAMRPPVRSETLNRESADRTQLFAVREAYSQLSLNDNGDDQLSLLMTIGQGLSSPNKIVRDTTADIVRHILSSHVRESAPANWHRNEALDAFFRLYKHSSSRSLADFLKIYPSGPEAEYLKTI